MPLSAFDEQNLFAAYLAFKNVPNGSVFELKRVGFIREVGLEDQLLVQATPTTPTTRSPTNNPTVPGAAPPTSRVTQDDGTAAAAAAGVVCSGLVCAALAVLYRRRMKAKADMTESKLASYS